MTMARTCGSCGEEMDVTDVETALDGIEVEYECPECEWGTVRFKPINPTVG